MHSDDIRCRNDLNLICRKLVLLAPVGLWLDEHPVTNWVATAPQDFPALLFHRPDCDAAVAMFTPPDDPDAAIAGIVATVWATGCTSKFLWPVPDKGLSKRIHRITAPTLSLQLSEEVAGLSTAFNPA